MTVFIKFIYSSCQFSDISAFISCYVSRLLQGNFGFVSTDLLNSVRILLGNILFGYFHLEHCK